VTSATDDKYWTRAHRDWRVRVAAVIMALAMAAYVLTGNLARRQPIHAAPAPSATTP
jgi:hypothetical protein